MTKREAVIEQLIKSFKYQHSYGDKNAYEYKRCEIKENGYNIVSLILEVGLKGDEGTMAAIYARDRAHFFIGPKGGITVPVHGKKKVYFKRISFGNAASGRFPKN